MYGETFNGGAARSVTFFGPRCWSSSSRIADRRRCVRSTGCCNLAWLVMMLMTTKSFRPKTVSFTFFKVFGRVKVRWKNHSETNFFPPLIASICFAKSSVDTPLKLLSWKMWTVADGKQIDLVDGDVMTLSLEGGWNASSKPRFRIVDEALEKQDGAAASAPRLH